MIDSPQRDMMSAYLRKLNTAYTLVDYSVITTNSQEYMILAPYNPNRVWLWVTGIGLCTVPWIGFNIDGVKMMIPKLRTFQYAEFNIKDHFMIPCQEIYYIDAGNQPIDCFGIVKRS